MIFSLLGVPPMPISLARVFLTRPTPVLKSVGLVRFRLFGLRPQLVVGSVCSGRFGRGRFSILIYSRLNRTFFRFSPFSPRWIFTSLRKFPIPFRLRRRG